MDQKTEREDGSGLRTDGQTNMTLIRGAAGLSVEANELTLEITRHDKEPQGAPAILKKNKAGGATLPGPKTYYQATVMKAVLPWLKNGNTGPGDRVRTQR